MVANLSIRLLASAIGIVVAVAALFLLRLSS